MEIKIFGNWNWSRNFYFILISRTLFLSPILSVSILHIYIVSCTILTHIICRTTTLDELFDYWYRNTTKIFSPIENCFFKFIPYFVLMYLMTFSNLVNSSLFIYIFCQIVSYTTNVSFKSVFFFCKNNNSNIHFPMTSAFVFFFVFLEAIFS